MKSSPELSTPQQAGSQRNQQQQQALSSLPSRSSQPKTSMMTTPNQQRPTTQLRSVHSMPQTRIFRSSQPSPTTTTAPNTVSGFKRAPSNSSMNNDNSVSSHLSLPSFSDAALRDEARRKSVMEAVSVMQRSNKGGWEGTTGDTDTNTPAPEIDSESIPTSFENSALDNFNLLSVVTAPTSMMDVSQRMSPTHHRISNNSSHSTNTTSNNTHTGHNPSSPNPPSAIPSSSHSYDGTIASITANLTSPEYLSYTLPAEICHSLDSWNTTLNSYSRNLLGNNYLLNDTIGDALGSALDFHGSELGYEDVPVHQLESLPEEIRNLDLGSVEEHLRKSGALTVRFGLRDGESERVLVGEGDGVVAGGGEGGEGGRVGVAQDGNLEQVDEGGEDGAGGDLVASLEAHVEEDPTSSVPEIFFNPNFDLTDPKTFESLLVFDVDDDDQNDNPDSNAEQSPQQPKAPTSPVGIPKPPGKLTQDLDTIELALLNQVRSKSDSFFRETNRFSYLKSLVAESVEQVQSLRSYLRVIRERSIDSVELIPIMDRRRSDMIALERILEEIMDVVEVKGSVAGLIAAGDYLGAVEAIYMARNLLNGDGFVVDDVDGDGDNNGKDTEAGKNKQLQNGDDVAATPVSNETNSANVTNAANNTTTAASPKRYELGKLLALSKISDQLTQFENLVVMDLSNELIEILLFWDESPSSTNTSSFSFDNDSGTAALAGSRNGSSSVQSNSSSIPLTIERRTKVKHIMKALQKCQKLSSVADAYRDKLCDTIRVTVRTTVNECAADAAKDTTLLPSPTSDSNSTNNTKNASDAQPTQQPSTSPPKSSITEGITSMTFEQFMECLNMIFEQVLALLKSAAGVSKFFLEEGIFLNDHSFRRSSTAGDSTSGERIGISRSRSDQVNSSDTSVASSLSPSAVFSASDLSHKSLTELLRLRKEAHSLVSFEEMKRLWDSCLAFTLQVEKFSGQKAYSLRSTLLSQAKAFVERRHEGNMSSLVATLDGERWTQCDVSAERQAALQRLCSGRAVLPSSRNTVIGSSSTKQPNSAPTQNDTPYVIIEGKRFRAVWSCLLLVEMIMHNVSCAAHFQTLATNAVSKTTELLRRFNSRATQLVLGAGAIHSSARLKSINAKHLALVTQCVGVILAILPHVRAALMAQLPSKQHGLLGELDKIKKEYLDHNEMVLSKFVTIIGGIVEHGLYPRIAKTQFDKRAKSLGALSQRQQRKQQAGIKPNNGDTNSVEAGSTRKSVACCPFLDGVNTNTKKMHQVLLANLPAEDLTDVFSRIFAHLDSNIPKLFIKADADDTNPFKFPITDEGKCRMIMEIEEMAITLNNLSNVRPWEFAAMKFLERRLDVLFYTDNNSIRIAPTGENVHDEASLCEDNVKEEVLDKSAAVVETERQKREENQVKEGKEGKSKDTSYSQRGEEDVPMYRHKNHETKVHCNEEVMEPRDESSTCPETINITEHDKKSDANIQECGEEHAKEGSLNAILDPQLGDNKTSVRETAQGTSINVCNDNGQESQCSDGSSNVSPENQQKGQ